MVGIRKFKGQELGEESDSANAAEICEDLDAYERHFSLDTKLHLYNEHIVRLIGDS